jgi:hypothetical protein
MAKSNLIYPIDTLRGKITKKSKTVFRRKGAYDENGNLIAQCAQESYVIENPRDWKKNPPRGAEKQRLDNWTLACQRAKVELMNEELAAAWKQRFQAQLKNPEADAPIDPKTRKPKTYIRLDCFVRAAILRSLQA